MQQEIVVQVLVDISLNTFPYVGKVANHALPVQCFPRYGYGRFDTMPMQVTALAWMVHEAMAVAKIDFFGNGKHSC